MLCNARVIQTVVSLPYFICLEQQYICPLNDFVRAALLIGEHVLRDPQIQVAGVVAVVDIKGLYLHHVRHYTPLFIKRLIHIVQECYPLRVKGVYIVDNPPLFELLYAVARPFLKTKIVERIHFIGDDYDKLHAFIPPELLPREYGGIHEPYDCDGLEKELRRNSRYFEEIDQSGYQTK
ncbi:alpha-tocopherol transfer protein-like [Ixodes scapularis]|uniref:alpha-tocopherol transfer protein-like n=1 Tax=Ixodes scapularis TaxID=6945 RepID=UPI001A9FFB7F|nr:alpha-tocopherol transfer protein-like [Ixodes scapularis]